MTTAQEHLETTTTAQNETQTLSSLLGDFPALAEVAAAAVSHAIDELATNVGKTIEQLETAKGAADQATAKGEEHVESAAITGHGTLGFAQAALEECQGANLSLDALSDMLEAMIAAITDAKSTAVAAIMGASAPTEEVNEGVKSADNRLSEAITHINAAIHS